MCRFTLYLGPPIRLASLVTEPTNSLIHQSFDSHERTEPLNGDGFGVAWYVPDMGDEPVLFRSITPAWSNRNLRSVASKTRSGCILAHVRAATPGFAVAEPNTHPFVWSRFAFAHNGRIGGFRRVRRPLLDALSTEAFDLIEGSTDSEHFFAVVVDELLRQPADGSPTGRLAAAVSAAMQRTVSLCDDAGISDETKLNVVITDGHHAVASRFTTAEPEQAESLYVCSGSEYVCESGTGHLRDRPEDGRSVIVASEPLTDHRGWTRIPGNRLVVVDGDRNVDVRPLTVSSSRITV